MSGFKQLPVDPDFVYGWYFRKDRPSAVKSPRGSGHRVFPRASNQYLCWRDYFPKCTSLTPDQQRLVADNVSFANRIARYITFAYVLDPEEAMSGAYVGLVAAASKFDPSRGVKFKSYAFVYVRRAALQATIVPKRHQNHILIAEFDTIQQRMELDDVYEFRRRQDPGYEIGELTKKIEEILRPKPRSLAIMQLRYIDRLSLTDIGVRFNITQERVRQIIRATLIKLRERLPRDRFYQ